MAGAPTLSVSLPAGAASVARARAAVAELAREVGASEEAVAAVKLAVSEACTNVVVHAYRGRPPGAIHLRAKVQGDELQVEVLDDGPGIVPRPDSPGLGLGLALIATLADSVELEHPSGGAPTTVRMTFTLTRQAA